MKKTESKQLKQGDRVKFVIDDVNGTIAEVNWHAVKIVWDDGQIGIINHNDMGSLVKIKEEK